MFFSFLTVSRQGEEKAVQNCEQLLADLRRRSTNIAPLKLRRNTPSRSITVESLCDWETDKVELNFFFFFFVRHSVNQLKAETVKFYS